MSHLRLAIGDYVRVAEEKSPYYGLVGEVVGTDTDELYISGSYVRVKLNDGHTMTLQKAILDKANLLDILADDDI